MSRRPLILLSNDEGYQAQGLRALREALADVGDVVVCAPFSEQSATSHAISLTTPLRLREHGPGFFSVDGTPADCVYLALCAGARVVPRRPDLVLSGINHGLNLGADVFYSGTVAAAREAALRGLRGLALSAAPDADLDAVAECSARLARAVLSEAPSGQARGSLFNVNFPAGGSWGMRATRLGLRQYEDVAEFRHDPRGGEYLWLGGSHVEHGESEGSATEAYDRGEVGVTPLSLEMWQASEQPLAERIAQRATDVVPVPS
jgi:5'-nucleotidase